MALILLELLYVGTILLNAINYLIVSALYLALLCLGVQLLLLSKKKKAISKENVLLKELLYVERKKHEGLRNVNSIMRLLRDLQHSFTQIELIELELAQLVKEVETYNYQWTWMGDQMVLGSEKIHLEIKELINNQQSIKAMTRGFDLAELILRKSQSCELEQEDKEILKTEFVFIYEKNCKKGIDELQILKKPLKNSNIVPYDLLECAPTIELLENYFSCFIK